MFGLSIACATKNLSGGVVMIDTVKFDLSTFERVEKRSFYFNVKPSSHTFKNDKDYERWDDNRNDVEEEIGDLLAYLDDIGEFTLLAHNPEFEITALKDLLQESFEIVFGTMIKKISIMDICSLTNMIYGEQFYAIQTFDYLCDILSITKGNKALKQIKILQAMISGIQEDMKQNEPEKCLYCGSTAIDKARGNCFLCGKQDLESAWLAFNVEFAESKPFVALAIKYCKPVVIGENKLLLKDFSAVQNEATARKNLKLIEMELASFFDFPIKVFLQ